MPEALSDSAVLLGSFLLLMLAGVPVFFAMGLASAALIAWLGGPVPLNVLASSLFQGLNAEALLAIPFFMLAGDLMNRGGLTRRLVAIALALVGALRGGLSLVAILATMLFSGVSGSAIADASAIGSALIPAMKQERYPPAYAAAVVAAAATMGPIIPPSIPFVLYGLLSASSVSALFLAGLLPGLLMGVALLAIAAVAARRRGLPRSAVAGRLGPALRDGWAALGVPAVVLGSIVTGWATPTEAGAVAAWSAALVGRYVHRELRWRDAAEAVAEAMLSAGALLLVVAAAGTFAWLMANMALGPALVAGLQHVAHGPLQALLWLDAFFLLWGLALDPVVALMTFVPVLMPVLRAYGIDPVHFGVVLVLNLMIGLLTPPVGLLSFIAARQAGAGALPVFRELLPFTLVLVGVLLLVTCVPALALWLPALWRP